MGYGYTADGGATCPLRGTGVGLMPTLGEVLADFAGRELLLDLKNDDPAEARLIAGRLAVLPAGRLRTLTVSGGDTAVETVGAALPGLRLTSTATIKNCLLVYEGIGWTGHVPSACHRVDLRLPDRYGRWLWGWPYRFVSRMEAVDTRVILVAGDGRWSEGFDDEAARAAVPAGWSGWLWTNRADRF